MKFSLSKKEAKRYLYWLKLHNEKCQYASSKNQGAIGGRISFQFTPTSLGVIKKIICSCGTTLDLTPYEDW
jgi:hypothetical protein